MEIIRQLIRMANDLNRDRISDAAYAAARRLVLDTVGCLFAGYAEPGVEPVQRVLELMSAEGDATRMVYGGKRKLDDAALINSVMIHALDLDDTHRPAILHIMCKLFPVAIAVGEWQNCTGQEVLDAIIAGVEVGGRIGRNYRSFAFLNSNVAGGFGVTYAACRLMGLDEHRCMDAMGIYYAQLCGNRQALLESAMCKRIQPGFAARNAIWAAVLASEGFSGAHHVLEGKAGLFAAYGGGKECPAAQAFTQERNGLEIEVDTIKLYPTCGAHHAAMLAAVALRSAHCFAPDDIAGVDVYLEGAYDTVGHAFEVGRTPQINAQFSAAYGVAAALLRDDVTLELFRDDEIPKHSDIVELAKRIQTHPRYDGKYKETLSGKQAVRLRLVDGAEHEAYEYPDTAQSPTRFQDEDVCQKFRNCAAYSGICTLEKAEVVIQNVFRMDQYKKIGDFVQENLVLLA